MASGTDSFGVGVSVGLKGGSSSKGGEATWTSSGSIYTEGEGSKGIQPSRSAAAAVRAAAPMNVIFRETAGVRVGVGGDGGDGSSGGKVTVKNTALISTKGDNAAGISAEVDGGGGGAAGYAMTFNVDIPLPVAGPAKGNNALTVSVGGKGGTGAIGGAVVVETSALINTEGVNSYGINARSVGGGGGDGGLR